MLREEALWGARREILNIACNRLSEFGVPCLVWKGADFAFSLYDSPLNRPMSDLDLLVGEGYAGMASALLLSRGFKRFSPGQGLFSSGVVAETKFTLGGFLVELHTHPLYHPDILPGALPPVSALKPVRYPGGHPAPAWPETMVYTLIHHADSPVLSPWQQRDVALLCGKMSSPDWRRFTWLSVRSGWPGRIAELLKEYGSGCPDRVMDTLKRFSEPKRPGARRGTLYSITRMNGWKRISFAAAVFHRALSGRKPVREG